VTVKGLLEVRVDVYYEFKKKDDHIIIRCPELDLYTLGIDEEEAVENLRDAITLFFMGSKRHWSSARRLWNESLKEEASTPCRRLRLGGMVNE